MKRISQRQAIYELMTHETWRGPKGRWWTFDELKYDLHRLRGITASPTGISARIREFEHEKRVRKGYHNLWEYRVKP